MYSIRQIIIYLLILVSPLAYSQTSCSNAGFEFGNLDGFEISEGLYTSGNITYSSTLTGDQHNIMLINDGIDPIAEMNCIENNNLAVVGEGLGNYSLKLGDANGGSRVAKIAFDLDVTPQVSFLILNYAVILDDPGHSILNQPTFQMNITNQQGEIFDCGHYEVTAGANIDGFENCGNWRVRPWTASGFELQSYIGQTVHIEVITTDCGLGGHGGYAYIDMTCQPLEIILDNYCEDNSTAYMTVTEGFDKYEWSTGDSTNQITINNPTPGSIYSVEVTSATGCSITLTDTLPPFEELDNPELIQVPDTTICEGSNYWFAPQGTGIDRLYLVGYGQIYDSILINALDTSVYEFVAKDMFGCISDTMQFTVNVIQKPNFGTHEIVPVHCDSDNNGSITIIGTPGYTYALNGANFQTDTIFENLPVGTYTITYSGLSNCTYEQEFQIINAPELFIYDIFVTNKNCHYLGQVSLGASGLELQYSLDQINYQNLNYFYDLEIGTHTIYVKDKYGCMTSTNFEISEDLPPEIIGFTLSPLGCSNDNRTITLNATSSSSLIYLYDYSYDNNNGIYDEVTPGDHALSIRDINNCRDTIIINVPELDIPQISAVQTSNPSCNLDNGEININIDGGYAPYIYNLNSIPQASTHYVNLEADTYTFTVQDSVGCTDSVEITLENNIPIEISDVMLNQVSCDDNVLNVLVNTNSGTTPIQYSIEGQNYQLENNLIDVVSGSHYVVVMDGDNCKDSMLINVQPTPNPTIINYDLGADNCDLIYDSLNITAEDGVLPLEYSINNAPFQSSPTFYSLPSGTYNITVKDALGCSDFLSLELENKELPKFNGIISEDSLCTENNGTINLSNASGMGPLSYSINNSDYQTIPLFEGLSTGLYQIKIKDINDCTTEKIVDFHEITTPNFTGASFIRPTCIDTLADVYLTYEDGNSPYSFWVDTSSYSSLFPIFQAIESGDHTFYVEDKNSCRDTLELDVPIMDSLDLVSIEYEIVDCDLVHINVVALTANSCKPFTIYFNDHKYIFEDEIEIDLPIDNYYITLLDDCGCQKEAFKKINNDQAFFIPDGFNPNSTNGNNVFKIYSAKAFEIQRYQIYDRWGNLLFQSKAQQEPLWWNGKKNNQELSTGVYIYAIEVLDACHNKQTFSGDITLIK